MKLADLLTSEHILLDMKATGHWSAIEELVARLVEVGSLPAGLQETTLEALREREALVSTGIGSGVAIPHTFSDDIDQVTAVFGRSRSGIDFEALDDAPVHLIILFIVPRKDYHLHLRTLAAIAKMFTNPDIRRCLMEAGDRETILSIMGCKTQRQPAGIPSPAHRGGANPTPQNQAILP